MINKIYSATFLLLITIPCHADLPLTIEDLLTKKQEFRFEFGLNYANSDRSNVNTRFDLVQTGISNFILLPIDVSNQRQNSDILALTLGARYGITAKTELYSRLTATADDVRTQRQIVIPLNSGMTWF